MVGLAFIIPQTSEETAVVDDDDNRRTTKPASRGTWAKKICKWDVSKSKVEGEAILFKSR